MDVSIVTGCYNEHANIVSFIELSQEHLKGRGIEYEIIVVDESSNPDTIGCLNNLSSIYPEVRILRNGSRTGLLNSEVRGLNFATGKIKVVMDCDLQHDPAHIPDILSAFNENVDLVIMSRYLLDGKNTDVLVRRIISNIGRIIDWSLLDFSRSLRDPTSGFFALKNAGNIQYPGIRGEKTLMFLLSQYPQLKMKELPYVFNRRKEGSSSLMNIQSIFSFINETLYYRKTRKRVMRSLEGSFQQYLPRDH